ncbi:MAG: site-2 protease family protein [Phycisphaerae bacterium]|nr:site-2 protease family protein [Phycisphaerae bacterium]
MDFNGTDGNLLLAFLDLTPQSLVGFIVLAPLIALSLTVHEFWHAYSAELLGDHTAKREGRCTLNPLMHLDPIGTIALFIGPVGWARPVPFDPRNFRNASRGTMITVAAGPASNLGLALIAGLLLRALPALGVLPDLGAMSGPRGPTFVTWLYGSLTMFMFMNTFLCLFNLIPLYPLDGHHLFRETLKGEARQRFIERQHLGVFVLIALLVSGPVFGVPIIRMIIGGPAVRLMELFAGEKGLALGLFCREGLDSFMPW